MYVRTYIRTYSTVYVHNTEGYTRSVLLIRGTYIINTGSVYELHTYVGTYVLSESYSLTRIIY